MIADNPYVIEVNPRFQDTLECVERALSVNLVDLHLKALEGELPKSLGVSKTVCAKGILYARKKLVVAGDLTKVEGCVDIPPSGINVDSEKPVCSAIACGENERQAIENLKYKIEKIKRILSSGG